MTTDDTPDTLSSLLHAAVVIREPGDPHNGRAGTVDRVQTGPWIGRWPILVRFDDGDTRWYQAANVERTGVTNGPH
jgi:hypothetical protein